MDLAEKARAPRRINHATGFRLAWKPVRREHKMLAQTKSRKGKKLLLQKVEEYRGDVGRFATIVHHADFPGLEI